MSHPTRKQLDHTPHAVARFGADFFITICCDRRGANQLCKADIAEILLDTARIYHEQRTWYVHLLLLMPDHLHAIIGLAGDVDPSESVRAYKRITAREAGVKWQRNYFDHRIRHNESLKEKSDYILQNPVRAGLVANEEAWKWVVFGDARGTWRNRTMNADTDSGA